MLNILVFMKQTFSSEEIVRIDNNQIVESDVQFVINPYDEFAVEEAVLIKEREDAEVTVVTFGPQRSETALRTALAMGADKAVLIDSDTAGAELDEYAVSHILAAAARKFPFDLILCGNSTIDGGSAQTGPRLAELLDIPHVMAVTKVELLDGKAIVERDVEGDTEKIEAALPVLLTTQQGLNEPRYPTTAGNLKAKRKPLDILSVADLAVDAELIKSKTERIELALPKPKKAGQILSGTLNEQVKQLAHLLVDVENVI